MRGGAAATAARPVAGVAAFAVPVVLALRSEHLAGAPVLLVASTLAGALAAGAFAVAPWLAALGRRAAPRRGRIRRLRAHAALGMVTALLVAVHVGALVLLEPDDAVFAMSPAGPTRARMALLATVLLTAVVVLGLLRRRLGWSGPTWRLLHGGLATLAVVLGIGHAVLTDGALEGVGTLVLVALALAALVGVAVAGRGVRRSAREPAPAAGDGRGAGTARAAGPPPGAPPSPTPRRR